MKSFLINTWKFIGLAVMLYVVFMFFISSTTQVTPKIEKLFYPSERMQGSTYERTSELNAWLEEDNTTTQDTPKVLLIGASSCYRNIYPALLDDALNINSFNAGSAGMNTALEYHIVESITSEHKIDAIILELCPLVWNLKRSSSFQDWIINSQNPLENYVLDIARGINRTKEYVYYFYRVVKYLNPIAKRNPRPYLDKTTKYVGKGFDCIDETPSYKPNYQNMELDWSDENWAYLNKIIELNRERGIKTIALSSPTRDLIYDLSKISDLNISHIDMNKSEFQMEWFQDELHMNCEGAHMYTTELANQLKPLLSSGIPD